MVHVSSNILEFVCPGLEGFDFFFLLLIQSLEVVVEFSKISILFLEC